MRTSSDEKEYKYEVPPGFVLPDLTGLPGAAAVGDPVEVPLQATYYDTPGLRLAGHGVTLRQRSGGSDAGWHLKRPAGPHQRTETRVPDGAAHPEVPAELDTEVRALRRDDRLTPVVRIRTRRVERPVRDAAGRVLAVVADDLVSSHTLREPTVARQWRELEVELVDGPATLLDAADAVLRRAGARPARVPSKFASAVGGTPGAGDPGRGHGRGGRALLDYLRAQRDRILATDPGVRRGDAEALHDMRVAVRRLRATLRTFRPVLDAGRTEPVRAELRWLGRRLGAVRDHDVLSERLDRAVHAEPPELVVGPVAATLRSRLLPPATRDRGRLAETLDSHRYTALLDAVDALTDNPPLGRVNPARLRRLARKALRRADRHLTAADRVATHHPPTGSPPAGTTTAGTTTAGTTTAGTTTAAATMPVGEGGDRALHEARKAYKRARYAVEVLRPLSSRPARTLAKRLSRLQDVLGEHHDAVAAGHLLRDHGMGAHLDGENAFSYGLLHARQHAAAARALADLPTARRRATRPKPRRWLRR
jgi:CHAD domain-containing protein